MHKTASIALALYFFQAILIAQSQPVTAFKAVENGLVLADVETSEFHSRFTGQDYHVYVSLPGSYSAGNQRYPVLYVLDLEEHFLTARTARKAMNAANMLEEFILVGVPLKVKTPAEWSQRRILDLTPTKDAKWDASRSKQLRAEVHSGGAAQFLRALKEELIPYIESRYRANADRGLSGYSLGSLFATYVWINDPNTFSRYLIGSPSLWWDGETVLKSAVAKVESGNGMHGRIYLSVGADEGLIGVNPFKSLATALSTHPHPDRQVESRIVEGADHLGGILGTISLGIKFLYAREQPPK